MQRLILLACTLMLIGCEDASAPAQPQRAQFSRVTGITTQDLGTLGGNISVALAINQRGQVIGFSANAEGAFEGFLWDGTTMRGLGALSANSYATDVNARGDVVGWSLAPTDNDCHPVLWENAAPRDLGSLGRNPFSNVACPSSLGNVLVNARGEVAGISLTAEQQGHAFLWDGTMRDLGPGRVAALNKRGQVAGTSNAHAVLWDGTTMLDLGTLGGTSSSAAALNDRGQVAGTSSTASGESHAFLWDGTTMQDLGTLGGARSAATALNNRGEVVGTSGRNAFFWDGTTLFDLGAVGGGPSDLGSTPFQVALNDAGQIIGTHRIAPGVSHATLWTVETGHAGAVSGTR